MIRLRLLLLAVGIGFAVGASTQAQTSGRSPRPVASFKAVAADKKDSSESSDAAPKPYQWAEIKISGELPEGPSLPGLFGEISESLNRVFERLDAAVEDPKVAGIVLRIENPSLGFGKVHELSSKIAEVRKAGKPVYAQLETAMTVDYLIAAACDKIYMPEPGLLLMTGLRAEVSFYKDLLEKLDVEADILRVGKFKSAAEPYTRTEMSPEFKQEIEEMLDDQFELIITTIAQARQLDADKVREAINSGPLTPQAAKEFGLIDDVRYSDELEQIVLEQDPDASYELVEKYGKKKVDTDFEGFSGLVKMMNLMMGNELKSKKSNSPQIAVIYANGAIMTGRGTSGTFGENIIGSESMVATIREAAENDRVKAIVLRVNSPGGSATASDLIWRALEKVEKPVVVSMGDVAASGGYYISMGADYIYVEPGTITGSIGVVGGKLAFQGLFQKIGITTTVLGRGENSGALSMMTPFTDSERQAMQKMMNEIYEIFTRKAAEGRKMPVDQLKALAGGRIYTGKRAVDNGLVDEIGTLEQAIVKAAELAKLDNPEEIDRLLLPKPTSPFEQLFGPIDTETRSGVMPTAIQSLLPVQLQQTLRHALLIEQLSGNDPRLLLLPYQLQIK